MRIVFLHRLPVLFEEYQATPLGQRVLEALSLVERGAQAQAGGVTPLLAVRNKPQLTIRRIIASALICTRQR